MPDRVVQAGAGNLNGITDPVVRGELKKLWNLTQMRGGQIGESAHRFVTLAELDAVRRLIVPADKSTGFKSRVLPEEGGGNVRAASTGFVGAVFFGPDPPPSPQEWLFWWNTEEGALKVYYKVVDGDPDSSQWVDAMPHGQGEPGTPGTNGTNGTNGTDGVGVPAGGSTGQALVKVDGTDYNTQWAAPSGGGMALVSKVVTAASQSVVTFSTLGAYTDLLLVHQARDTATGSGDLQASIKLNNDGTAGNYDSVGYVLGNASAASSGTIAASANGLPLLYCPGTSGNANAVGGGSLWLHNYAGTTFYKMLTATGYEYHGSTSRLTASRGGIYKNTAAITRIDITAGGAAFVNGSTFSLYGLG